MIVLVILFIVWLLTRLVDSSSEPEVPSEGFAPYPPRHPPQRPGTGSFDASPRSRRPKMTPAMEALAAATQVDTSSIKIIRKSRRGA